MTLYFKNKKKIYFSKMHGLGNDFIVINCIDQSFVFLPHIIEKLSNRYTGIGFDQLLIVEKSKNSKCDFKYRIFNGNGNEVEQCGNGARCFAFFVLLKGLTYKKTLYVETLKRNLIIKFVNENTIKVNMSEPEFILDKILASKKINNFSIKLLSENLICSIVSMGNPHCVIKVQCIKNAPVNIIGQNIQKNIHFPQGINVGFMEIINRKYIKLRVYERDVGETQSCGSGACAAVAIGIAQKLLSCNVKVDLPGGHLIINWKGFGYPLYMTGPAKFVYDGVIYI